MHTNWFKNLDQHSAVLAPTRSLANTLNEKIAQHYIDQNLTVWEAPNILIWGDYIRQIWHANRVTLNQVLGVHQLISAQQSLLLWTQIIEASRREEEQLTLLNVQQTARAVQRSWVLMQDWQISVDKVQQDHVADTQQFVTWINDYQALLSKRGLIDEPSLLRAISSGDYAIEFPYKTLTWYAFDLINAAQVAINRISEQQGTAIVYEQPAEQMECVNYVSYRDTKTELKATLLAARQRLEEQPDATVNIVIHDLQDRQAQVEEIARDVFYPQASPLEVQKNSTVYRFSLGQRLSEWASVDTALRVISLLKNRTSYLDVSFLLRNQFLGLMAQNRAECRAFDRWLKSQRIRDITFDNLPKLYEQCIQYLLKRNQAPQSNDLLAVLNELVEIRQQLEQRLNVAKQQHYFAALSFTDWVDMFTQWLNVWGWSTHTVGYDLNTVQHQLLNRWNSLLEEFAGLAAVQRQIGIKRALDLLSQMTRDTMFIPKAAASPILISSILEAVGRPAEYCFVVGMNDAFPPAPKNDAFIPQRLLADSGHPDMNADSSFVQADMVIKNLLKSVKNSTISYAAQGDQGHEIVRHCSPLFRSAQFTAHQSPAVLEQENELIHYRDTQGPAWQDAGRAKGGSKIFENQSHCPFKAFITHQLGFQAEDEAEFGLDHLDRGNVVHNLLDLIWQELQTQQQLLDHSEAELRLLINQSLDTMLSSPDIGLTIDKQTLLERERPRLLKLLTDWLEYEKTRPSKFMVIEREEQRIGELSGIRFKYIIDRLDMTDDGRTFIIDYKTGLVNRKDWIGEAVKSPQMPLYCVALDSAKNKPVSGIAYASVRQHDHSFVELSESDVFRKSSRYTQSYEQQWHENRQAWPSMLEKLANDFLSGQASVDPIDESICGYCDLKAVCRVSQLRQASAIYD